MQPWGQAALAEQLAICTIKILRALGDGDTQLEDLVWSPYEHQRRQRDVEDLDDEELEEAYAADIEADEQYESQLRRRQGTQSDPLTKRFEGHEL